MDTKQALESINDSDFESLVLHYLAAIKPELTSLIHTGSNEAGKTIACKVDAIFRIPGAPVHYVAVAATATARKKLKGKWLADIQSASEEFDECKKVDPDAICELYLATNRHLKSNTSFQREIIAAVPRNVVLQPLVEASILIRFLDFSADGHFIRQKLLGIDAERLSLDLLRQIGAKSLDRHQTTFGLDLGIPDLEITREVESKALHIIENSSKPLIGVRGASGTGKSTLVRQIGKRFLARGKIVIWVLAERIDPSSSLLTVLTDVLQSYVRSLHFERENELRELIVQSSEGIILIVDDINRLPNPQRALNILQDWLLRPRETNGNDVSHSDMSIRCVIPLRPIHIRDKVSSHHKTTTSWDFVDVGFYSPEEEETLARTFSDSNYERALRIIRTLKGDPFLCGLAFTKNRVDIYASRAEVIRTVFEEHLNDTIAYAQELAGEIKASRAEYVQALDHLVQLSLELECPVILWSEILSKFQDRERQLLNTLGQTNRIGIIDHDGTCDFWSWKHNRLRDAFIGRWLANNLLTHVSFSGEKSHSVPEQLLEKLLHNAGLAEAWALAMVFLEDAKREESLLTLSKYQPVALALILRLNLFPEERSLRELLAAQLRNALTDYETKIERRGINPEWWIIQEFMSTDDPLVLEILSDLPSYYYICAIRLRNGDLPSGLKLIAAESSSVEEFPPAGSFPLMEQAIYHFGTIYDRPVVADQLSQNAKTPMLLAAAMIMTGYLQWPELWEPLWSIWRALSEEDQLELITPTVWMLSRCGDEAAQAMLRTALLMVRKLDFYVSNDKPGARYDRFLQPMRLALPRWNFTPASAKTWAEVIQGDPELQKSLSFLLQYLDYPSTLDAYVHLINQKGVLAWPGQSEPIDPLGNNVSWSDHLLSEDTRQHLWGIFMSETDPVIRSTALYEWKKSAQVGDLPQLRGVGSDDPMFDSVLKIRLKLRDATAAHFLMDRIYANPGEWCGYAPLIYDAPGVSQALTANLESALNDFRSGNVMQYLPESAVRKLITEEKALLFRFPRRWLSLWRSNVPEALTFLQEAVGQLGRDEGKFWFITGFPFPVTPRMLNAIAPVFDHFSDTEQVRIIELAIENGHKDWVQQHIDQVSYAHKENIVGPSPNRVIEILNYIAEEINHNRSAAEHFPELWRLSNSKRNITNVSEVLKKWLGETMDEKHLRVAEMLLQEAGTDIDIDWWQKLEPPFTEAAHVIWQNALSYLQRLQWNLADAS